MKRGKQKQNPLLLLLLVLLILLLVIYGLYLLFLALFQNTLTDNFINIIGIFVIVALLAGIVDSINKKTLKKLKQSESRAEVPNERDRLQNEIYDLEARLDALVPEPKVKKKNNWTSIPAVIVFFACLFWMFRILSPDLSFLSFIGGGDITGRWINDTQIVETGMQSYTEYWYMDIYDDGTLDIGWKNEGYSEESQGWGTWEEDGSYYYVVIYYDYGATISAYLDIEGSKLIDASSKTDTGYRRG